MSKYGPCTPAEFGVVLSEEGLRQTHPLPPPLFTAISGSTHLLPLAGTGQKSQ